MALPDGLIEKENFIENFIHYVKFLVWFDIPRASTELIQNADFLKEEYQKYVKPAIDVIKNKLHYDFQEFAEYIDGIITFDELSEKTGRPIEKEKYAISPCIRDIIKEAHVVRAIYFGEHTDEYIRARVEKNIWNRRHHTPWNTETFEDIYNKAMQAKNK